MVLRSEHHVLLAGGASQVNEGVRIEFGRIKPSPQLAVFSFGDAAGLGIHDRPRGLDAGQRIRSPMDEHAKLGISIPGSSVFGNSGSESEIRDQGKTR